MNNNDKGVIASGWFGLELQNEVEYRFSLVSKSLPVKLGYFVSY